MTPIVIDPEFRAQIPPLGAEELAELERSIREHGIRDALVVWREQRILLDGHHRYEIARRLGAEYRVVEYDFVDRAAAADWIDRNQLGRRNLTPDQMSLLIGRRYNRAKNAPRTPHRPRRQNDVVTGNNATAKRLAIEHGVGQSTVERAGRFAAAVEQLKPIVPDIEQQVISGKGPTRKAVREAAQVAKEDPAAARGLLAPPAPRPQGNGLANGVRRLPCRPLSDRLARGVAQVASAVEVLESIDFSGLTGSTEMVTALESVDGALQRLRRFRKRYGRN